MEAVRRCQMLETLQVRQYTSPNHDNTNNDNYDINDDN